MNISLRVPGFYRPVLWLAAFCLVLPSLPSMAQESVAQTNSRGQESAGMAWLSGGVGDEALQEMRKVAANYNVHVIFSDRQGKYLANIPFKVDGKDGQNIHSGVSDGPLLYLKLAPGNYQVAAEIDGQWQHRRVRVAASKVPVKLVFVTAADR